MKIVVLDGKQLNDLDWSGIESKGETTKYDATPALQTIERAKDAEIILVNKVKMTREIIESLPKLRYIGVLATGYDNVDLQAARDKGIVVTNVPGYSTDSVAQLIFALLLELCHHVGSHSEDVIRNGKWSSQPYYSYWDSPLIELSGKTMGIVGMGKIGRKTAEIARSFGMRVLASSRTKKAIDGVEWVSFEELLTRSDVVSMSCPLTDETRGIMNKQAFARMKNTAFFINTARGAVVVEEDLKDALNAGEIAGAAADVMSIEPPSKDNPLFGARNIIITPHIAWATREARQRLLEIVCGNLTAWLEGNAVNTVN